MEKYKCIFVGNALPVSEFESTTKLNSATNTIQLNFIDYIINGIDHDCEIISSFTNTITNKGIIKTKTLQHKGNNVRILGCVNTRIFWRISSELLLLYTLIKIRIQLKQNNKTCNIIFFVVNPYSHFLLPVFLAKRKRDLVIDIMMEGIHLTKYSERSNTMLNRLKSAIGLHYIKHCDGIATFNNQTVNDYAKNVPSVELLHSHDAQLACDKQSETEGVNKHIFCGSSLTSCYGYDLLLDAFQKLPNNYILTIAGGGDSSIANTIIEHSRLNNRIIFLGRISKEQCIQYERDADCLIQIRKTSTESERYIATYFQPSKIGEYFLSGTPFIANDIPAIPRDMIKYITVCNLDAENIARCIRTVCEDKSFTYFNKSKMAQKFAVENLCLSQQEKQFIDFVKYVTNEE